MNKISKKIVSVVTMGAFALTLIPAAAFGASWGGAESTTVNLAQGSHQEILPENGNTSAEINVELGALKLEADTENQIALWVGTDEKDSTPAAPQNVTFGTPANVSVAQPSSNNLIDNVAWYYNTNEEGFDVPVTFSMADEYPLYAGVLNKTAAAADGSTTISDLQPQYLGTVTVVNASSVVDADDSQLLIDGNHSGDATQNKATAFEFNVLNNDGSPSDYALNANGGDVYLWVTDKNGVIVTDAEFSQAAIDDKTNYDVVATDTDKDGIWQVTSGTVNDGDKLNVTIPKAGEGYIVNAVVATDAPEVVANNKVELAPQTLTLTPITLDVAAVAVDVAKIEFSSVTDASTPTANADNTVWYTEINDNVTPSDTKVYTVKGVATDKNGAAIENEEFYVTADDNNMKLQGLSENGTVTTNAKGEFTFNFTLTSDGKYGVKLSEVDGNASATLIVKQGDVDAIDIEVVKDGGYVLAGTDRTYAGQVFDGSVSLADAVQFSITDAYGRDAMGPGPITDEWAAKKGERHADSLEIKDQPDDADVTADDFYLIWDETNGVYTLEYRGAAKDFTAGDYQVRVALNNGGKQAVTVSFTAAEFGDVQELVLDMKAADRGNDLNANNNAITAIDNQVALGQVVNVYPKYVDANGLKVDVPNYNKLQVGINGDAVDNRVIGNGEISFATPLNTAANNAYVGSTITVRVNDPSLGAIGYVEKELTVVKNYLAETVSIDPTQGVVGEANTVTVSVVDENGNVSKVNGKLTATIVGQSDEEATVDLKVNPQVKNGTARMYLESDKAGTVDVRVVVTAENGELYADTFTYTFGDEDPYAGTTVVMVIGSDQYLINNEVLDGSVDNLGAPYVDSAWRTMVPVRVLAESFGADVDFDEEAQTVTIVDGDTTIVMTVGSTEYTINGEAADPAMDTAPVIGSDNRTYVPVRFVAEGLGYEVSPLYNAENGTTSSVVFQK